MLNYFLLITKAESEAGLVKNICVCRTPFKIQTLSKLLFVLTFKDQKIKIV